MCVNCMMKLKPLVLNEKCESGPKPAEGLGVPGVCGKQPGSGAKVERRAVWGWQALPWPGLGEDMQATADHLSWEEGGLPAAWKKLRHVLGDLCSESGTSLASVRGGSGVWRKAAVPSLASAARTTAGADPGGSLWAPRVEEVSAGGASTLLLRSHCLVCACVCMCTHV